MHHITRAFIDFLFPSSPEEVKIRTLPLDWLFKHGPKASRSGLPFISSLFLYKDPLVRELVWQIKYKKNIHAIKCAGYALNIELSKYKGDILLIPIPISKKRHKERGYNQCELLVDEILKLNSNFKKDYNLLIRTKHIDRQTLKNRSERIQNTKDIFQVTKSLQIDIRIIIIDDVVTTGSTLREARKALLESGYRHVECLTLAH